MDNPQTLTHVSLCAGYGGIDLGLTRALGAVRTIAFSEIEAFACENLVKKMEQGHIEPAPIWTDLKTFPWASFCGKVDILSGGFPCQPFSAAGRRAGDSDPRHLWPHIVKGIEQLGRPPVIFLENVEGIISSRLSGDAWSDPAGTPVLLHILRELERLGYQATAGLFSAREIGAPHQRKRVFILATNLNSAGRGIVNGLLENVGDAESGASPHRKYTSHKSKIRQQNRRAARYTSSYREQENVPDTYHPRHDHAPSRGLEQNRETLDQRRQEQPLTQPSRQRGSMEHTPSKQSERPCIPRLYGMFTLSSLPKRTAYPAPRGADQYPWEPPRTTKEGDGQHITSRTDELRLLGNGVVPDTAARAFCVLWQELCRQT